MQLIHASSLLFACLTLISSQVICSQINPWITLPREIIEEIVRSFFDENSTNLTLKNLAAIKCLALTAKTNTETDKDFIIATGKMPLMALFNYVTSEIWDAHVSQFLKRDSQANLASHHIQTFISLWRTLGSSMGAAAITHFSKRLQIKPADLFLTASHDTITSYQFDLVNCIKNKEYEILTVLIKNGWPLITTEPPPYKIDMFVGITNGIPLSSPTQHWGHHVGLLQNIKYTKSSEQQIISEILRNSYWLVKTDTVGSRLTIRPPQDQQRMCLIL